MAWYDKEITGDAFLQFMGRGGKLSSAGYRYGETAYGAVMGKQIASFDGSEFVFTDGSRLEFTTSSWPDGTVEEEWWYYPSPTVQSS